MMIGVVTDARLHRAAFNCAPVETVTTAPPAPPVTPAWAAKPSILAGRTETEATLLETPTEELDATLLGAIEDLLLDAGTLLGATDDLLLDTATLLGAMLDAGTLLGATDDLLLEAGMLLGATDEVAPTMP